MSNRVDDVAFEPKGFAGMAQQAARDPVQHGETSGRRPQGKAASRADEMIALINDRRRRDGAQR